MEDYFEVVRVEVRLPRYVIMNLDNYLESRGIEDSRNQFIADLIERLTCGNA